MKSIMEEASSIIKAIEKGWASAGQPKEFTIKIFEEPQKNFIGLTTRPAKIGIFFQESAQKEAPSRKQKPVTEEPRRRTRTPEVKQPTRAPKIKESVKEERAPREMEERQGPVWSDEMVATVNEWVTHLLPLMDLDKTPFTIAPEHFHLRIEFQGPLLEDKSREKHLFASLSSLLLTMLKRQYRRPLKGYKIVLVGG
jgi:predicted RNA-binding protein Jag